MTDLDRRRSLDDPGYPKQEIPERRDLLGWLGWTLAFVGLIILIVAVAVVAVS